MKLSRESRYGLEALRHLAAREPGTIIQARELAEAEGLPPMLLAKILTRLVRHGILRSYRGRERGYALAREPSGIRVREVLVAIEGPDLFQRCLFWSESCSDEAPCLLHETWKTVKPVMAGLLDRVTLAELAQGHELPTLADIVLAQTAASRSSARRSRGP